ncbi:MAG TPA: hypothetical protein VHN59_07375 [Chitinophagaceae bacterium]|nr:hypothetical protein [Chitinophagaceae bacterium]
MKRTLQSMLSLLIEQQSTPSTCKNLHLLNRSLPASIHSPTIGFVPS